MADTSPSIPLFGKTSVESQGNLEIVNVEHPEPVPSFGAEPTVAPPAPRKRGWPKGKPRKPRGDPENTSTAQPIDVKPSILERISSTGREQEPHTPQPHSYAKQEVQSRLETMISGLTAIPGAWKPYFQATPEESRNMAEPLASFLIRRAPDSQIVRQFLDEYDIVTFLLAVAAYAIRVIRQYRKEKAELAERNNTVVVDAIRSREVRREHQSAGDALDQVRAAGVQPTERADEDDGSSLAVRAGRLVASHPSVPGL